MTSWTSGYVTEIPYAFGFYRELAPANLRLIALLRGLRAPATDQPFAYAELACGQGLTTNLLAAANPMGRFWGMDFNPAQIVGARALAAAAGLGNVQFSDDSFESFAERDDLPEFDFIALHGTYSWISAENRAWVRRIIARRLKPGGLVYVSYNCLPGWTPMIPVRRLMTDHAKTSAAPIQLRIEQAMGFVEQMIAVNGAYFVHNPRAKERFERMKPQPKNYLAHEYFNQDWTPLWFSDVAAEMAQAKLAYLGSANPLEHIDAVNLLPDQLKLLATITQPDLRETVRDFMMNQQFRKDVYVKGAVPMAATDVRDALADTRFVLTARAEDVPMKVSGALGEASLQEDVYRPVIAAFAAGARTPRSAMADPALAAIGWPRVAQALYVLAGAGQLAPCLDAKGDEERTRRARAFNAAVQDEARRSGDLAFLASPLTGTGHAVDRLPQLFLAARAAKHADPVRYAWEALDAQGHRLLKDGVAVETPEANLAELAARHAEFLQRQLPALQALAIA